MIPLPANLDPPLCKDQIVINLSLDGNVKKRGNEVVVVYKNVGNSPCQTFSRPLPSFMNKTGDDLPIGDTRNCGNMWNEKVPARTCEPGLKGGIAPRLTIPPGETAHVKIEWNNKLYMGRHCLRVYSIRIAPFQHDGGADLPMRADMCGKPGRMVWSYTGVLTLDR